MSGIGWVAANGGIARPLRQKPANCSAGFDVSVYAYPGIEEPESGAERFGCDGCD